jgi:hypothetical protein
MAWRHANSNLHELPNLAQCFGVGRTMGIGRAWAGLPFGGFRVICVIVPFGAWGTKTVVDAESITCHIKRKSPDETRVCEAVAQLVEQRTFNRNFGTLPNSQKAHSSREIAGFSAYWSTQTETCTNRCKRAASGVRTPALL